MERALWLAIRFPDERARLTGRLADAARERGHVLSARQFSTAAEGAQRSADALLLMLKETRGFDFTGYKRSTLHRRVRRRMALLNLATFGEYRDYLELQPDEFSLLFDSMLINVTSFFRDPENCRPAAPVSPHS